MLDNDNPNPNTNPPGPLRVEGFDSVPRRALNTPTNQLDQFLPGPSFSGGAFIEEEEEVEEEGVAGGLSRKLQQVIGETAAGGQVTISGSGLRVRYLPPAGFTGRDIAIYTACDVNGLCNSAFIFLEVRQDSPSLSPTLAPNFP